VHDAFFIDVALVVANKQKLQSLLLFACYVITMWCLRVKM